MSQNIIRAVAPSELVYVRFSQGCGVIGCVELSQKLDLERLEAALGELRKRHPLISSVIQKGEDTYYFCKSSRKDIPLRKFSDGNFSQTYQEALNLPFDLGDSLIHAFYNESETTSYVVVLLHHSIADGTSVSSLLHQLLTAYSESLEISESEDVPHAIDGLLPAIAEDPQILRQTEQDRINQLKPIVIPDIGERDLSSKPEMFVSNLQLDESTFQKLQSKSKSAGCTINSSVSAALILTADQLVKEYSSLPEYSICIKYAVDLRRRLQPVIDSNVQCSAVTAYNDIYRFPMDGDFWSFAQSIKQEQHAYIEDDGAVKSTVAMLRSGKALENANVGLMISNIGVVKTLDEYSGVKVLDAHVHATVYAPRPVATLLTVNGCLNIDVAYTQPYTSELYIKKFLTVLDGVIRNNL